MREKTILLSLIVVAFILAASVHGSPVQAQTPDASSDGQYFPETGHRVKGDFLTAYQMAKDPLKVYGYPITDQFLDQLLPNNHPMVQFFERAELRYYPLNPPELKVVQVRLGEILYNEGTNQPFQFSSFLSFLSIFSHCQYFTDSPHPVCNGFLDFFTANGGVAQFGSPISDAKQENGNGPLVQWFQNACMEWAPEKPFGQRVVLRNLGRIYFDEQGENPELLFSGNQISSPHVVISLQVHGFVNKAVMDRSGEQTANVIVLDQSLRPVENADVTLKVQGPSGKEAITLSGSTDKNGISSISFDITDTTPGIAKISITANYISNDQPNGAKLQQQAIISFLIWY